MSKSLLLAMLLFVVACRTTPEADTSPKKTAPAMSGMVEEPGPGGTIRRGRLVNGQREGLWQGLQKDGTLMSQSHYLNGQRHGASEVYFPDGSLRYTGTYHKGQKVGKWDFFDDQGTLVSTAVYDSLGKPMP
jgi:MORN repeat variant